MTPLHPWILCDQFGSNWTNGITQEEHTKLKKNHKPDNFQIYRKTNRQIFSPLWIMCEIQNKKIQYSTKKHMLRFLDRWRCKTNSVWWICKQLLVEEKWINNQQQCNKWYKKWLYLTTSFSKREKVHYYICSINIIKKVDLLKFCCYTLN